MVKAQIFNWQDYLQWAKATFREDMDEATSRCVISRAYYAAYWKARRRLEKKGIAVHKNDDKAGCHAFVWSEYAKKPNTSEISVDGKALRLSREHADYISTPNLSAKKAQTAIEDAEKLIEKISSLEKSESN